MLWKEQGNPNHANAGGYATPYASAAAEMRSIDAYKDFFI
jgi:hypothetical protein